MPEYSYITRTPSEISSVNDFIMLYLTSSGSDIFPASWWCSVFLDMRYCCSRPDLPGLCHHWQLIIYTINIPVSTEIIRKQINAALNHNHKCIQEQLKSNSDLEHFARWEVSLRICLNPMLKTSRESKYFLSWFLVDGQIF